MLYEIESVGAGRTKSNDHMRRSANRTSHVSQFTCTTSERARCYYLLPAVRTGEEPGRPSTAWQTKWINEVNGRTGKNYFKMHNCRMQSIRLGRSWHVGQMGRIRTWTRDTFNKIHIYDVRISYRLCLFCLFCFSFFTSQGGPIYLSSDVNIWWRPDKIFQFENAHTHTHIYSMNIEWIVVRCVCSLTSGAGIEQFRVSYSFCAPHHLASQYILSQTKFIAEFIFLWWPAPPRLLRVTSVSSIRVLITHRWNIFNKFLNVEVRSTERTCVGSCLDLL